jgi:holo-[acyl-carrier protein] synthase
MYLAWAHAPRTDVADIPKSALHAIREGCRTPLRVGADVALVGEVVASLQRFGDRYLARVFTDHEVESCRAGGASFAPSLAARFAAKEATLKVLRPVDHQPNWRSIEVRRSAEGWCEMHLTGLAARLAGEARITELAVSLTHEGDVAAAVVVALCSEDDR